MRAARRPLALQPGEFVGDRVRLFEDLLRPAAEVQRIALVIDRKPAHADPVDGLDARPARSLRQVT